MRSWFLLPLAVVLLAWALPLAATAQDYSPSLHAAQFDPLPIEGTTTPVTTLNPTATVFQSYVPVQLPFEFFFFGQGYWQVNMSNEGIITFGTDVSGRGQAWNVGDNQEIPTAAAPTGYVAAWWDNHTSQCDVAKMKSQTHGEVGQRWFVLEWSGCSFGNYANVQMQIWLKENSPIIRVYYGDQITLVNQYSTCSATVGLENPATYDRFGQVVTTGGTVGTYGLLDENGSPLCTNNCKVDHWPAHAMIQYGTEKIPDLQPGGLRITSLVRDGAIISATVENTIYNSGRYDADGVTWDHYLSRDDRFDENDVPLNCRHFPPKTVPGADSGLPPLLTASTDCEFPFPERGRYRLCTMVDPDNVVFEGNESNNWYCSEPFAAGVDLLGSVSILPKSTFGIRTPVAVNISNIGTDPTGAFDYAIILKDCSGVFPDRLAHTGTLELGPRQDVEDQLELYVDASIESSSVCAELVIDLANVVVEATKDNNVASTCHGVGRVCMELVRSNLAASQLRVDAPNGCFFGEPLDLEIMVCNEGAGAAVNFSVLFGIDVTSFVTLDDTQVISIPRSCVVTDSLSGISHEDPSLCDDLGGEATCIRGVCHQFCSENADCGNGGLECLDDPLLEADDVGQTKSCQLALDGGECKLIRTPAEVPFLDTRAATIHAPNGMPFSDGEYYFGAIVDWTVMTGDSDRANNRTFADVELCRSPLADIEVIELRSAAPVGVGEPFPVYYKVKNNGPIDAAFTYRYFLSTNQTPSVFDIPLDAVRFEEGRIVGQERTLHDEIAPFGITESDDIVVVPAHVVPGTYYLGVVVDPEDELRELTKSNNRAVFCDRGPDGACVPVPIKVVSSSFRVVTQGLPDAVVGRSYVAWLLADGGVGDYRWSMSSGSLPAGLALEPSGLIHGTVGAAGDSVFRATVRSGDHLSASATFVIRAIPAASPLTIVTSALPRAYMNVDYVVDLGASGGATPHEWNCLGLPSWARLEGGSVRGRPTAVATTSVTCTVTDAFQQSDSVTYSLSVIDASSVHITTTALGSFERGVTSSAAIDASGGSGSYRWIVDDASLPNGLKTVESDSRLSIEGAPLVCGHFLVDVAIADTQSGATDSAKFPLVVTCDTPRLSTRDLPVAVRGEDYPQTQLESEHAVEFTVIRGVLPRGLVLSKTGVLSGTVAIDADFGDHNVAIELRDAAGGTGYGALAVTVRQEVREFDMVVETTKGCSASGDGSAAGLLPLIVMTVLFAFRRQGVRRSAGAALVAALAMAAPATASAQSDLTIKRIAVPSAGLAGSWITVGLELANLGEFDAEEVDYVIVLSDNEVISEYDRVVHRGSFDIGYDAEVTIDTLAEIPLDTRPGLYHLGAWIDPDSAFPDPVRSNNRLASAQKISITSDGLRVATQLPASLQVGAPYCVPLVAEGGDGVYTWSLVGGSLPPGLLIDRGGEGDSRDGAWLCGVPAAVGLYEFALEVASGGMTSRTEASLEVVTVAVQLGIATRVLPIASFDVFYEAGMSANGGRAPYRWELLSGELPPGLMLDQDGLIYGVPLLDGEFSFDVRVQDADANTASAQVGLRVSSPGWITCSIRTLGEVEVGSQIRGRLLAGGGSGSYSWRSVRTQRFGDPGAPPLTDDRGPPPGIELRSTGALEGVAAQIGKYLWTVEVSDGANTDTCTVSLEVLPGPGLTVTTTALPIAFVDEEYSVQLQAAGGDGSYRWKLVDQRALPAGLVLGETGVVSGRLVAGDLMDDDQQQLDSRTWSFLVEVRDGQNSRGTGAMSVTLTTLEDGLTVTRRSVTTDSGCSTGGGGFGLVALGLVALGLSRRERPPRSASKRRSALRRLLPGLAAVVVLAGCGDTKTEVEELEVVDACKVRNTDCNDPTGSITCDPTDGLCKCGGEHRNGVICGEGQNCVIDASTTPPSPSCVSGLCEKVCGQYETCDPHDGICKCEGVECASGFTCVRGVCEIGDPCGGVTCPEGESCDPADRLCKCGSEVCSVGESCRIGTGGVGHCVGSRCVGMNCPERTECSPVDGLCHCGDASGPSCSGGQVCLVDEETGAGSCAGQGICDEVVCQGGTTCSPLDGKCRCGGFDNASPICGREQTCDQENRRCVGGDQCGDVVCPAGSNLSCDEEDGVCKCGGENGVVCQGEEGCVRGVDGEQQACVKRCNPIQPNVEVEVCGHDPSQPAVGCYFAPGSSIAFCARSGLVGNDLECGKITDCAPGHHCVMTTGGGVCRKYCDTTVPSSCSFSDFGCVLLSGAAAVDPHLGVCMELNR